MVLKWLVRKEIGEGGIKFTRTNEDGVTSPKLEKEKG